MTGENSKSAAEARVQVALRALPTPDARPVFRTELKRRFVTGTLAPETTPLRPREVPWFLRLPLFRLGLAAGAVAVLLIVLAGLNRGPVWRLAELAATGSVRVGEQIFSLEDTHLIDEQLRPGVKVTSPDSNMVDLMAGDQMWIEIAPKGEVILPRSAGRWLGRTIRAHVTRGEVRFASGPTFSGACLYVDTEVARVEMIGSTIAVIESPGAMCVCVYEGTVSIGLHGEPLETVPEGMRKIVYLDGREPTLEAIFGMERMKLQMLKDRSFPTP